MRGNHTGRVVLVWQMKYSCKPLTLTLKENLLDVHDTPQIILSLSPPVVAAIYLHSLRSSPLPVFHFRLSRHLPQSTPLPAPYPTLFLFAPTFVQCPLFFICKPGLFVSQEDLIGLVIREAEVQSGCSSSTSNFLSNASISAFVTSCFSPLK